MIASPRKAIVVPKNIRFFYRLQLLKSDFDGFEGFRGLSVIGNFIMLKDLHLFVLQCFFPINDWMIKSN